MKELYVSKTDLKDVCEELHNNPGSYKIFNGQKLTSDMTNDEMYLAITKMTESEYMKFINNEENRIKNKMEESTFETKCPICGNKNMRLITVGLTKEKYVQCASCENKMCI